MSDLDRVHILWDRLCSACGGATSLSAEEAVARADLVGLRELLDVALRNAGYPRALRSAPALGAALRHLRGQGGTHGAKLDRTLRRGGAAWFVRRDVDAEAAARAHAERLEGLARVGDLDVDEARVGEILASVDGGATVRELWAALCSALRLRPGGADGELVAALRAGARALGGGQR